MIILDVIFFIFLYQRYLYPVDYKRVNEFGTTGEMHVGSKDDEKKEIEGGDDSTAITDGKTPEEDGQTPEQPPKSDAEKKTD